MARMSGQAMYSAHQTGQQDDMVQRHAPLVRKIALHLLARLPASVQLDDLIQAGMIGLLEASRKYESGRGASFETYAGIRIRGAILDEIRRGDWVPRSVHRNARRVTDAIRHLEAELGRDARDVEIAGALGVSLEEYHDCLSDAAGGRLFSLDELTENADPRVEQAGSSGTPLQQLEEDSFREQLAQAITTLSEREQLVMSLYYQEELNLKEIGAVLSVSESRVSQILSEASLRLRSRLKGWT